MAFFFDDVTTSKELDIRNAKCAPGPTAEARGSFFEVFAAEARGSSRKV